LFFFYFTIFHFIETGQRTKTKIGLKDESYLEGMRANFQQDMLMCFGGRGVLLHL